MAGAILLVYRIRFSTGDKRNQSFEIWIIFCSSWQKPSRYKTSSTRVEGGAPDFETFGDETNGSAGTNPIAEGKVSKSGGRPRHVWRQ